MINDKSNNLLHIKNSEENVEIFIEKNKNKMKIEDKKTTEFDDSNLITNKKIVNNNKVEEFFINGNSHLKDKNSKV